jgi:hypothetical protein
MAPQSVISTTLQLLRDRLIDNSFLAHPLIRAIEEHGNLIKVSGGLRVEQPVIFGDHSSITELSNGFEPVSMAVTDPFQTAKFEYSNLSSSTRTSLSRSCSAQSRRQQTRVTLPLSTFSRAR